MKDIDLHTSLVRSVIAANIELSYFKDLDASTYLSTTNAMSEYLATNNVFFEGKSIHSISLNPTVLTSDEVEHLSKDLQIIRKLLLKVLDKFILDIRENVANSPVVNYFHPYKKWFHIIAAEQRKSPAINLMRYDTVFDKEKGWQVMETNTCCPGGVISSAKIKDAWMKTPFAKKVCAHYTTTDFPIDSATGFLRFLIECARKASTITTCNIAICSYKDIFTNELQMLSDEFEKLISAEKITNCKLILCDVRDINERAGIIYAKDIPVSLIYNKIDQLMINPDDSELNGWLAASHSQACEFFNSLGALYLTEAKRILSLLHDQSLRNYLNLSELECSTVDKRIPNTLILDKKDLDQLTFNRHKYVLKADSLTRGAGIYIGRDCTHEEWLKGIAETLDTHGVVQNVLNSPTKLSLHPKDDNNAASEFICAKEYYGLDLFFFAENFAGGSSRASISPIFNVGNGGSKSPVVTIVAEE
ncbi:hypothetical protein BH10PSE19_BH10PSE19_13990 [soil metagenome]